MQFDAWALWYLFVLGVFVPYAVVKSALRPRPAVAMPARRKLIQQTLLMEVFLAGLAIFAARQSFIDLFNPGTLSAKAIGFAVTVIVVALATIPLRVKFVSEERRRRLLLTRPQQPRDLTWWFAVSLFAGVAEELAYRGVMFVILVRITGNWWPAALLCAIVFAASHANQGWPGMVTVFVMAMCFQALVLLTGSLYLAMAMHFTYDFLAGVVYLALKKQLTPAPMATA